MSSVQNFERPFFINSTPLNRNDNRFMKWNGIGIIRNFKNDDSNQINVQFHDSTIHPSIEFENDRDYWYADLTSNAVAFASNKLLHCIHFTKEEENEWSLHFNRSDFIKAICLGKKFIAVATSNRLIRFYSLNGTQHHLIALPGPIACLIANNQTLIAVYHRMLPLPDEQSLNAMIFEIDLQAKSIVNLDFSPIQLPLTSGYNLKWIGFTDEGTLALFDSSGSLKVLKTNLGLNWIEIANLYQQVDANVENVFIVSVSDLLEEIRCVLCFKSKYPLPESIQVMSQLKFNLNLCKMSKEINDLEEKNILSSIKCSMLNSLADFDIDTSFHIKETLKQQVDSLFKLFQDANRNNNEMRQLDSAKLIPSLKTIESLLKYAEGSKLIGLVPKLNELIENKKTDANEQINLYTSLPNKQSTLQKNEFSCLNDITPLVIDKTMFDKPTIMTTESDVLLDEIELNRFNENDDEANSNAILIDENDELLKVVSTSESCGNLKNPFKI